MRILVIGLSNIGDAVLMSPVIQRLAGAFPTARLTLLVGERARVVFERDRRLHQVVSFEEFEGVWGALRLVGWMWRLRPDVLVDLRQTILPLLWRPWKALAYFWPIPRRVVHMRDRHLWRLQRQAPLLRSAEQNGTALGLVDEERTAVDRLMNTWSADGHGPLVVISPGARSHIKRWYPDRVARVADRLIEAHQATVIFTGEADEAAFINDILMSMRHRAHNTAGRMTLRQAAVLMQRATLVMTNDSAALHVACAVGAPTLALFGPTDPRKYGPTGPRDRVIQRRLFCVPCEQSLCRFHHECMRFISEEDVYDAASQLLRPT
ncbi:MAG: glycosyltransferase family 9 protein [Candidatus Omnitrophica bacterium]|nr:glycosyltransferase family 9 protein [Candidatus Omnitrophota bacterium]